MIGDILRLTSPYYIIVPYYDGHIPNVIAITMSDLLKVILQGTVPQGFYDLSHSLS